MAAAERERERCQHKDGANQIEPHISPRVHVGIEVYLKVFVPRHGPVGEFGQEHGNEPRQAPLRSQHPRADPRQPQHVLRDVGGLSLEHSMPAQTQGGWGQATQARWDGQAHAGEEAPPAG